MGTNTFIRDLDVGEFNQLDGRRVEVIADGLPLWHGAQLAIDTTLVSPLHGDGAARRRAATVVEWHCMQLGGSRRPLTQNSLAREGGLVWWCSRWSQEASIFVRDLAKARAQAAPLILQGIVQAAYLRRWSSLLACSLARAFCCLFVGETACARNRRGRSSVGCCSERRQVSVTS